MNAEGMNCKELPLSPISASQAGNGSGLFVVIVDKIRSGVPSFTGQGPQRHQVHTLFMSSELIDVRSTKEGKDYIA
eukprot:scaffold269416_cov17-Tisochrysis_lutea.AAC.1